MSKFICKNEECKKFGEVNEYFSNTYKYVNGKLLSNNAPCPSCGEIREEDIGEDIPLSQKNIEIGKYSSLNNEGKQEMLKKRSHEHFKKEIKPFKDHQLHEAVKQMKDFKKG